jgi:hypothetical protein
MEKKKQANKTKTVRFRIDPETNKILIARSLHFFGGNISAMIRHAIMNFKRPGNDTKKER